MRNRPKGHRLAQLALPTLAFLTVMAPQIARAEGCLLAPAKLSDTVISAFEAKPADLLVRFPGGGPAMSAEIMRYAGSKIELLPEIIELARRGAIAHRVAIGIGLARAAIACGRTHAEITNSIKQAVADSGVSELITAFSAGLNSLELSAASTQSDGGAPASGGGGGDGPLAAAGGGGISARPGGGSAAIIGTELISAPRFTSFSSRTITSTVGSSVSPTQR